MRRPVMMRASNGRWSASIWTTIVTAASLVLSATLPMALVSQRAAALYNTLREKAGEQEETQLAG